MGHGEARAVSNTHEDMITTLRYSSILAQRAVKYQVSRAGLWHALRTDLPGTMQCCSCTCGRP